MPSFWHVLPSWENVWIQDIFYKSQTMIHAHAKTLVLSRCYTTAQLASFDIFLVQR